MLLPGRRRASPTETAGGLALEARPVAGRLHGLIRWPSSHVGLAVLLMATPGQRLHLPTAIRQGFPAGGRRLTLLGRTVLAASRLGRTTGTRQGLAELTVADWRLPAGHRRAVGL